jgi:hypothetical protein
MQTGCRWSDVLFSPAGAVLLSNLGPGDKAGLRQAGARLREACNAETSSLTVHLAPAGPPARSVIRGARKNLPHFFASHLRSALHAAADGAGPPPAATLTHRPRPPCRLQCMPAAAGAAQAARSDAGGGRRRRRQPGRQQRRCHPGQPSPGLAAAAAGRGAGAGGAPDPQRAGRVSGLPAAGAGRLPAPAGAAAAPRLPAAAVRRPQQQPLHRRRRRRRAHGRGGG